MSFNGLSDAEAERLACLAEECGETIKAIGKILRHGYESYDPTSRKDHPPSNKEDLEREIGDVAAIIAMMAKAGDIDAGAIDGYRAEKLTRVGRYLHHQESK